MNSNNTLRNYKHDISGKFKDISTALASMDDHALNYPDNNEIFHAIHEVLLKMVKTSRNTIAQNLQQEIVLIVSNQRPNMELSKLQIEGVTVRYEVQAESMKYYFYTSENQGDPNINIGKLSAFLPFRGIVNEIEAIQSLGGNL
jgi:hypothetical protein